MGGGDDMKCRSCSNWLDQIYYKPSGLIEYVLFKSLVFSTVPLAFIKF